MTKAVTVGSLAHVAQRNGQTLAESFLSADVIVVVDVSGSMHANDGPRGITRYEQAIAELNRVQESNPGKLAVVAFSSGANFVPGGVPPLDGGSTNLADALRFVQMADGCVSFIVISDGEPDSASEALAVASKFQSKVNTIFVGPEGGPGRSFLAELARVSGGVAAANFKGSGLGQTVTLLLKAG